MRLTQFALLSVVFLDIMSQALVIPILNTVIMDPAHGFLPVDTPRANRQFDFGLLMGIFYLCWFLGAAYISKISDSIGRRAAILICLFGNFLGYVLTIAAFDLNNLTLLIVSRAIGGFTAGNQPIAQAALVDLSTNEAQKTRYLGLVLVGVSAGMVAGPLMGGVLSDRALLGQLASVELVFYAVAALVVANIALIVFFFHETRTDRRPPFRFRPFEVFLTLWHAARRPTVLRISAVFFFAQLALFSFYVFMDNYFYSRFGFDTLQNSFTMVVLGVAMGLASAFLVGPVSERFGKRPIVCVCLAIMAASAVLSAVNPSPWIAYALIVPFIVPFALSYPTMLTLFSGAVDESEQGWVMGVGVALATLSAGIISLMGGWLMSIDIHLPFLIAAASLILALALIPVLWRSTDMRTLLQR